MTGFFQTYKLLQQSSYLKLLWFTCLPFWYGSSRNTRTAFPAYWGLWRLPSTGKIMWMNTCPCPPTASCAKSKMLPQSFPKWGSMMKIFLLSQSSETCQIRAPRTAFFKVFYSFFKLCHIRQQQRRRVSLEITSNFNNFMCPIVDIILYSVFSSTLCEEQQRNARSLLASHHWKSVLITVN